MKKIGIIAEFNPFHNGHKYLFDKIKEKYPNSILILVLGGNFTQRGDFSIIDKWKKTDISLISGIDLVVELPFRFSTDSADYFAYGAFTLLNKIIFLTASPEYVDAKSNFHCSVSKNNSQSLIPLVWALSEYK